MYSQLHAVSPTAPTCENCIGVILLYCKWLTASALFQHQTCVFFLLMQIDLPYETVKLYEAENNSSVKKQNMKKFIKIVRTLNVDVGLLKNNRESSPLVDLVEICPTVRPVEYTQTDRQTQKSSAS